MENVGEYIRKMREEKGLGLRELSRRADISHSYLSQIENGNKKKPKSYILRALAQELDLDYKGLLDKAGYSTDWEFSDETFKEEIKDLAHQVSLFESNLEASKKGVSIPIFVDEENNVNIQVYKGDGFLNEDDTKELNNMIKGFLFGKKFIND